MCFIKHATNARIYFTKQRTLSIATTVCSRPYIWTRTSARNHERGGAQRVQNQVVRTQLRTQSPVTAAKYRYQQFETTSTWETWINWVKMILVFFRSHRYAANPNRASHLHPMESEPNAHSWQKSGCRPPPTRRARPQALTGN